MEILGGIAVAVIVAGIVVFLFMRDRRKTQSGRTGSGTRRNVQS